MDRHAFALIRINPHLLGTFIDTSTHILGAYRPYVELWMECVLAVMRDVRHRRTELRDKHRAALFIMSKLLHLHLQTQLQRVSAPPDEYNAAVNVINHVLNPSRLPTSQSWLDGAPLTIRAIIEHT